MSRQPRFCATYLLPDGSRGEVWGVVYGYPQHWSECSIQDRRHWYRTVAASWGLPGNARLMGFALREPQEEKPIPCSSETAGRFAALLAEAKGDAKR